MMTPPDEVPKLPKQAKIRRLPILNTYQAVVMLLLLALVVAAAFGLLGPTSRTTAQTTDAFAVRTQFESRSRSGVSSPVTVEIVNTSDGPLEDVRVSVSRDYLQGFESVSFQPQESRIGEEFVHVDLPAIGPGEVGALHIGMVARKPWRSEGRLLASSGDGDPAQLLLSTFVWP